MRRYILIVLPLISAIVIGGCAKEVHPDIGLGQELSNLTVKGVLVSLPATEYPSVIENNVVTIQVPYYLSDTEKVQGDLTKMKVRATLPIGARFEPGLSGIYNLLDGFQSTLIFANGRREKLTFKATYKKSEKCSITKAILPKAPSAMITYSAPENGEAGKISILKTSSVLLEASRYGKIEVSPWATWECSAINPDGSIDFSKEPEIKVIAQDGSFSIYKVSLTYPSFVNEGEVGYISEMFHLVPSLKNDLGFVKDKNRTIAVIGKYLVISDLKRNFLLFNRFSGEAVTDIKVNFGKFTEGGDIHAISADSGGHLVAISLAAFKNKWVPNSIFEVYVWKNGIENPPIKLFAGDVASDPKLADFRKSNPESSTKTWDIGRKIGIFGDVTNGDAIIATLSPQLARILRIIIKDGTVDSMTGSAWGLGFWTNQTTIIPLDNRPTGTSIHNGSTNMKVGYASQADNLKPVYMNPRGSWWGGMLNGMGYVEFNGMKIIGLMNSCVSPPQFYSRLVVENISNPSPNTFNTMEIMDSRLDNYDFANGRPIGKGKQNPTASGFTSFYNSDGSIGANGNQTGDVAFGKDTDGNAIQVYMLSTNHGVLAYEITRYDL